ncbi:imelysin family protein [Olleya sp. ITB9]|uniref:imelysin family protein n=1 Tax=Olleya sp. ITB9 TaxID=1715648 RepID=UPI0006CF38AA|nr:imelysin family protein [Olleya sp. ITB9]
MKTNFFKTTLVLGLSLSIFSCNNDDDTITEDSNAVSKSDVTATYGNLVYQTYLDSYNSALDMQSVIEDFIATPTEDSFSAAKQAWLDAREFYGLTEAFREATGPVDTESETWSLGTEGQMNAWPIDESYIDYVAAGTEEYANDYDSIIGDDTITIDQATLANYNEGFNVEQEKSISTGWHAIEFLLWGQDNTMPVDDLPGTRAFTDYTTADHADRRALYLQTATDLLVSDLNALTTTWATGGTYRAVFESLDQEIALKQLINGAFFIAGDELSSERIIAPVDSTDGIGGLGQEDEHSCFSDNTHRDIYANAKGVYNVIFGEYSTVSGASFYDLVKQANPTQAAILKTAAENAMEKVNAIANNAQPFDYLITLESSTDSNFGVVMQSVVALQEWADEISASATAIGISL